MIFSCGTGENFYLHLVLLGLRHNIPSTMTEILTLWSPHKLLNKYWRTLGTLASKFDKKFEILTLYPGNDRNGQKTISRYCPFKNHLVLLSLKNQGYPGGGSAGARVPGAQGQ